MAGRRWTREEIDKLGTAPDVEIAQQLDRSEVAVKQRRNQLGIPPYGPPGFTLSGAANHLSESIWTVKRWIRKGWLEPISTHQKPRRYSKDALKRAQEKAARERERLRESRANNLRKTHKKIFAKLYKIPRGQWGVARIIEEARKLNLKLHRHTLTYYFRIGAIPHQGRERINSRVPWSCSPARARRFLDELPKRHQAKRERLRQLKPQAVAAQQRKAKEGGLSVTRAAQRANVDVGTICNAVHATPPKLKPIGGIEQRPWRFSEKAVDDWAGRYEERTKDDVPMAEIPSHVSSEAVKRYGRRGVISRAFDRLRADVAVPYRRFCRDTQKRKRPMLCVSRSQLRDLVQSIDATLKGPPPRRDGELTLGEAASRYGFTKDGFHKRLKKYAPGSGRLARIEGANNPAWVFPEAAIDAAGRGEHWTPPQRNGNGKSQKRGRSEAVETAQWAEGESPPTPSPKKRGRPRTRDERREFVRHRMDQKARDIAAEWRKKHGRSINKGTRPTMTPKDVRRIKSEMRAESAK